MEQSKNKRTQKKRNDVFVSYSVEQEAMIDRANSVAKGILTAGDVDSIPVGRERTIVRAALRDFVDIAPLVPDVRAFQSTSTSLTTTKPATLDCDSKEHASIGLRLSIDCYDGCLVLQSNVPGIEVLVPLNNVRWVVRATRG